MSATLSFKLTQAGAASIWSASRQGISLSITHAQVGSGNRIPDGSEVSLVAPKQSVAFSVGVLISPTQLRMSAVFSGDTSYSVNEIGLWAGAPGASGSLLVAYWSSGSGSFAVKTAAVDFAFTHDMVFDANIPAGSLTIVAENGQGSLLAMIIDHESKSDPHPSYANETRITQTIEAHAPSLVSEEEGNLLRLDEHGKYLVKQVWDQPPEW